MFYLTTHSTHFIYGYMSSDIWLRTILIVRKETRCRHIGYSFRLTARVLLYAPPHRQDSTYHGLCYTNRGALAGTRNSSMGPPPWRIDPTTHRTMSERSYHGATSRSMPYRRQVKYLTAEMRVVVAFRCRHRVFVQFSIWNSFTNRTKLCVTLFSSPPTSRLFIF